MCDKFYVGFQSSDNPRWWMKFLEDGFHHCWIAKAINVKDNEILIMSEDMYGYASNDLVFETIDQIKEFTGALIIEIEVFINANTPYVLEPISCVTWVKKQLGIANRKIITPRQLANHLLDIGGKIYGRND